MWKGATLFVSKRLWGVIFSEQKTSLCIAIDNLWNKFWGESQKHFPQGEKHLCPAVPVPAVKGGNVARLKTPLRCAISHSRNIVVYAIDSKFWGEFYLSDLPPTILNIFQIWVTFILRSSPHFLLQSFPALIISCKICRHPVQSGEPRGSIINLQLFEVLTYLLKARLFRLSFQKMECSSKMWNIFDCLSPFLVSQDWRGWPPQNFCAQMSLFSLRDLHWAE